MKYLFVEKNSMSLLQLQIKFEKFMHLILNYRAQILWENAVILNNVWD